mmetsp:Transcript_74339/g.193897  ORF Transcript_74339/g.193897 Transcript_74339/m.193897 type:complete len:221 (-) Transcript_74339:28-690(-)
MAVDGLRAGQHLGGARLVLLEKRKLVVAVLDLGAFGAKIIVVGQQPLLWLAEEPHHAPAQVRQKPEEALLCALVPQHVGATAPRWSPDPSAHGLDRKRAHRPSKRPSAFAAQLRQIQQGQRERAACLRHVEPRHFLRQRHHRPRQGRPLGDAAPRARDLHGVRVLQQPHVRQRARLGQRGLGHRAALLPAGHARAPFCPGVRGRGGRRRRHDHDPLGRRE